MNDVTQWATALSVIGGALLVAAKIGSSLWQLNRRIGRALDIILGTPAIGETPERPGIVARLERIEKEVRPNGGTSMRDTVGDIQAAVDRVEATLERHIVSHSGRE